MNELRRQPASQPGRHTGRRLLHLALACLAVSLPVAACAQADPTAPEAKVQTPLDKFLEKVDLGAVGTGVINKNSSGTTQYPHPSNVTDQPGTTFGADVSLRYTRSPLIGFEINYGYARFTQKYTSTIITQTVPPTVSPAQLNVQANLTELTFGYVVHPRRIFGFQPFVSAGGGLVEFKPTPLGGQSQPNQGLPAFYYSVGGEVPLLGPHFGARAQFRQLFYPTPDFDANYLAIGKRTFTSEPGIGFFLRF